MSGWLFGFGVEEGKRGWMEGVLMEGRLKEGMGGGFEGLQKKNKKQLESLAPCQRWGWRRGAVTEQTEWRSSAHMQVSRLSPYSSLNT